MRGFSLCSIFSGRRRLPPADYVVTSKAEWDVVFGNTAATLSGKIVEVDGVIDERVEIEGPLDMSAEGAPVTIRGANSSSRIGNLYFEKTVRGVDFEMLIRASGWPTTYGSCVTFGTGTFGNIRFLRGAELRHGYGPSFLDLDTTADYPEYDRIDNVQTATTTSTAYALTWKDATATSAWCEFFNRGSETVYVAFGGPGVTATTGSQAVAAGARFRFNALDPTTDTHVAILSASGTSEINARTEVGLPYYLANAFGASGSAVIESLYLLGAKISDVSNAVKGIGNPDLLVVMDCDLRRVYQDLYAFAPSDGGAAYILRNTEDLPFARSGIAEDLNGDARDPHGDQLQLFGSGAYTIRDVYYAGNRPRLTARRTGVSAQGVWISDNDISPAYENIFIVSTIQPGGASRAVSIEPGEGTADSPKDFMLYGITVFDGRDLSSNSPAIDVDHDDSGVIYVDKCISPVIIGTDAALDEGENLRLTDAADRNAVFPNLASYSSAETRAQIESALATAAEGAGLGAVATANLIDWTTSDHEAVIRWNLMPSGVAWDDLDNQSPSTVVATPLSKVLNRRSSQAVTVGAGTEWRSVDTDRTTEVQAWTSSAGTIAPDQFIQIRRTSGAGGDTITASVTINGFEQSVAITSAVVPTSYLIQGATAGWFLDPNFPPAAAVQEFRGKFYFPSGTLSNGQTLFCQEGGGARLETWDAGFRLLAEDGTGANVIGGTTVHQDGNVVEDVWFDVIFILDHAAEEVRLTVDGTTETIAFTSASNGAIQTNREHIFCARDGGGNPIANTVQVADLELYLDGALRKAISNTAATANADAWHQGGNFTQG